MSNIKNCSYITLLDFLYVRSNQKQKKLRKQFKKNIFLKIYRDIFKIKRLMEIIWPMIQLISNPFYFSTTAKFKWTRTTDRWTIANFKWTIMTAKWPIVTLIWTIATLLWTIATLIGTTAILKWRTPILKWTLATLKWTTATFKWATE